MFHESILSSSPGKSLMMAAVHTSEASDYFYRTTWHYCISQKAVIFICHGYMDLIFV
jgi:hypothetical protein